MIVVSLILKINDNHGVLVVIIRNELWHQQISIYMRPFYQNDGCFWVFFTASTL